MCPRMSHGLRPRTVRGWSGIFCCFLPRFSHTSPDESRTSHGLRPSDQANRPRTMPDHAGWAPDEPRRPRISHGFAMVHPRTSHGWPRMSHGRAPNIPDEPRTSPNEPRTSIFPGSPRIAPDVLNILKPPGSTPDPPESPRMYKDEPRTCHGPSGTSQGWPRMPPDR